MNKIKQLFLQLKQNECFCQPIYLVFIPVLVLVFWMLFTQTNKMDALKRDNFSLIEQNNVLVAEVVSLKAQLEYQVAPVITQETKPLDIVIQSNTKEIKGKVEEIQQQLVDSNTKPVQNKPRITSPSPAYKASDLNSSMLDTFCKTDPAHKDCKEKR